MQLLFALFAFVAVSSAAVFHIPLTPVESNRARLTRLGKWQQHKIAKDLLRNKGSGHQDLTDYDDVSYIGNITVGTPATQQFRMIMDTSSANLFVMDKSCSSCSGKSLYDRSKSSTFVNDGRGVFLNLGSGGAVSGVLAQETISLGVAGAVQMMLPNQTFLPVSATSNFQYNSDMDGILGLAFPTIAMYNVKPPVINAIDQGLFDMPLFTIWLKRVGSKIEQRAGQITYGAIDVEHCSSDIAYQPLSAATYWQFRMKSIAVSTFSAVGGFDVMTSTIDSYIGGPFFVIANIASKIGATQQNGDYYVKCDAPKYPIRLTIGSAEYIIKPEDYILRFDSHPENVCTVMLYEMSTGGYGPSLSLGEPLFRSVCQIFDVGQQRVGFSTNTGNM